MHQGILTNQFENQLFKYQKQYLKMLLLNYKGIMIINKKR